MIAMHEICELLETLPKLLRNARGRALSGGYAIRSKELFLNDLEKILLGKDAQVRRLPQGFYRFLESNSTPTRSGKGWYFASEEECNEFLVWIIRESLRIRFQEYLVPPIRNSIENLLLVAIDWNYNVTLE